MVVFYNWKFREILKSIVEKKELNGDRISSKQQLYVRISEALHVSPETIKYWQRDKSSGPNSRTPELLDELVNYVNTTDDHPLIVAAVVHYQLVTIHPFEDGNGRTARLMSGYILDLNGYGFYGIGSLEEYFAYDAEEYYRSLQMGLPALYYSGRDNPPHPEIWVDYFLRMMELYSAKVCELSRESSEEDLLVGLSYLNAKEKELLVFLIKKHLYEFAPIDVSKLVGVTSKTIINRCAKLSANGFLVPVIVKERIRSYRLSDFTRMNEKKILNQLK